MDAILNFGISFTVWLQALGDWLAEPMKFFSFLGSENFFLILLPVLYWCVDAEVGLRMSMMVLLTSGVNSILKLSFHGPRPYWFSTQVKAFAAETSFGVPSSHAQVAVGLWGTAAARIRRAWAWWLAGLIIFLVGFSRLYLGVHFLHDVLIGWLIGGLILWAFISWWDAVAAWAGTKSTGQQIGLSFALSVLMLVGGIIAIGALRGWVLPAVWLENARQAGMEALPAPVTLQAVITSAALIFGVLAGLAWMNARGGFSAEGSLGQRFLRLVPGFLGILILYLGLRVIFPGGDTPLAYFFRYLRYGLVGLWMSAGAPWIFRRLNLVEKKDFIHGRQI